MSDKEMAKEIKSGSQALCGWLSSQNIEPAIAGAIMANVIAAMIVAVSNSKTERMEIYEGFAVMLRKVLEAKPDAKFENWRH